MKENPIETVENVWKAQHDSKLIRTYCMFFNHLVFCLLFICTLSMCNFSTSSSSPLFYSLFLFILNRHYSLLLTHIMYLTTQLSLSSYELMYAIPSAFSIHYTTLHISSLSSYFHTIFCLHIHFFSTYIIRVLPFISNSLLCLFFQSPSSLLYTWYLICVWKYEHLLYAYS